MLRVVHEVRPHWVLAENVPALRTRGADRVLHDLEKADYTARVFLVGAEHVGAPHERQRVWIVAHAIGTGWGEGRRESGDEGQSRQRRREFAGGVQLADAFGVERIGGMQQQERGPDRGTTADRAGASQWPSCPGEAQHPWEAPRLVKFPLGGAVDGIPVRLVRAANKHALKAFGNAVVPQVVEEIGRMILDTDEC
jgi:DNA (cytosine-5)-methyltransferase 1